ncbi:MAG: polyprenyl synthetase family protein [Xanthomonadales bacterium]|nr:polyprenyl synthetase family protein [Xanthomonadales bacterium]
MNPELAQLRATIEDALDQHLPRQSPIAQSLVDAMRYAALSGGKRLRPMLVCATCTGLGGALEDALAAACAVEFMHAYSLVHDDLPAMDDDALRHGLPSTHIKYGDATAVLVGDALQSLAFETLATAPAGSDAARLRGVQLLAQAVGWQGMAGGQVFDLDSEGKRLSLSDLQGLHAAKTGALISAAVQLGALSGNPTLAPETYVLLSEFAARLGLAFQVIDDVLDETQPTDVLGKPAGSDSAAGKSTYPALMGVDAAREFADQLLTEALSMHERAGLNHNLLAQLAVMAVDREY